MIRNEMYALGWKIRMLELNWRHMLDGQAKIKISLRCYDTRVSELEFFHEVYYTG